jgi:hypothetical protein
MRKFLEDDLNHPDDYLSLTPIEKEKLSTWITEKMKPAKSFNMNHTSYGLKHLFERDTGIYVSNGQFKGAMLLHGFEPKDVLALNWIYKIRRVR